MFKRKKESERTYKVENLGGLIIERVHMPHSLTEADGSHYEVMTWTLSLRVANGPIFFERSYIKGSPEALEKMNGNILRRFEVVEDRWETEFRFYNALSKKIRG